MSADEKWRWWASLASIWGAHLGFLLITTVFGTEKGVRESPPIIGAMAVAFTATFLLILSWRAAYLGGKSRK